MKKVNFLILILIISSKFLHATSEPSTVDEVSQCDPGQLHLRFACQEAILSLGTTQPTSQEIIQVQQSIMDDKNSDAEKLFERDPSSEHLCSSENKVSSHDLERDPWIDFSSPVFYYNPEIKWEGLPGELAPPRNICELIKILKEKKDSYNDKDKKPDGKPSHVVCIIGDYVYKFLNLTKKDGTSDEEPETEMLCASCYEAMGIPELIARTTLTLSSINDEIGFIQRSPYIKPRSSTTPDENEKTNGQQFIMSLLLGYGDAKKDNFIVDEKGDRIAIDTEMAFRRRVRYDDDRGTILGMYSCLFKEDFTNKKIDENVKKWFLGISDQINIKIELEALYRLIFDDFHPMGKETFANRLYQSIMDNHHLKQHFLTPERKKNLFNKLLYFFLSFTKIQDLLKDERIKTYGDLLKGYDKNLFSVMTEKNVIDDDLLLKEEKFFDLSYISDFEFRMDHYKEFVERLGSDFFEKISFPDSEDIEKPISYSEEFILFLKFIHNDYLKKNTKKEFNYLKDKNPLNKPGDNTELYRDSLIYLGKFYQKGIKDIIEKDNNTALKFYSIFPKSKDHDEDYDEDFVHKWSNLKWDDILNKIKNNEMEIPTIINELEKLKTKIKGYLKNRWSQRLFVKICLELAKHKKGEEEKEEQDALIYIQKSFEQSPYKGAFYIAFFGEQLTCERIKDKFKKYFCNHPAFKEERLTESISYEEIIRKLYDRSIDEKDTKNNGFIKPLLRFAEAADPNMQGKEIFGIKRSKKEAKKRYKLCREVVAYYNKFWYDEYERYIEWQDEADLKNIEIISGIQKNGKKYQIGQRRNFKVQNVWIKLYKNQDRKRNENKAVILQEYADNGNYNAINLWVKLFEGKKTQEEINLLRKYAEDGNTYAQKKWIGHYDKKKKKWIEGDYYKNDTTKSEKKGALREKFILGFKENEKNKQYRENGKIHLGSQERAYGLSNEKEFFY